jgi:hypothetical protein
MKKQYIILAVLAVGALAYYFLVYKKDASLGSPASKDPFDIDDAAAYTGARSLIPKNDQPWVDAEVAKVYAEKRPEHMINGRLSKTLVFIGLAGTVNPNVNGKFIDKSNNKVLWPQQTFDDMWTLYRNPLVAKYGGLA